MPITSAPPPQQHAGRPLRGVLLITLTLILSACGAARAAVPPAPPSAPATAAQSARPTQPPPTLAPIVEPTTLPTVAPTAASAAIIIVEPPFKPPQTWHYNPAELTITVGQTITWTNTGAVLHTVTADDGSTFDSGNLTPKTTFSFTPPAAGTIAYHCTLHPWMKGTITIKP